MRRRQHAIEGQDQEVRRVQHQVDEHDDGRAEHQRPRNRPLRVARLLCGVRHHMPSAEGEQPRRQATEETGGGHSSCGGRRRQRAPAEQQREEQDNRADLRHRQTGLHRAAWTDAHVVDAGQGENAANGGDPDPGIGHRHDGRGIPGEHHRNSRDDPGVHAPEHRPAPQKSGSRRKHLPEEHVHAAGPGKRRRQFGADARAKPCERAGNSPYEQHAPEARNRAAHFRRLNKDRRADDGAHHHRGGLHQPDRSGQWLVSQRSSLKSQVSSLNAEGPPQVNHTAPHREC